MSKKTPDQQYADYQKTYSFKHLEYSLSDYGTWEVKGEDANCDLGGSHYQPTLGYFEGKLEDIIRYGVTLPNFWQWGGGGTFRKIEITKIDKLSIVRKEELALEKAQLEKALAEINSALGVSK